MQLVKRSRFFGYVTAMAVATLTLAGCHETKSPTEPVAPSDVAGSWIGTYEWSDLLDSPCVTPAQATIQQSGSSVSGTLSTTDPGNSCQVLSVTFQGTIQGTSLAGTLTGTGLFTQPTATSGTLLNGVLSLGFKTGNNSGGVLNLHR
jgi:hypothetical protein